MVLDPAYGYGNTAIAVSADLDFDKVEEQKTEYEPISGTDTGILRSLEATESTTSNMPLTGGGVAGASANLPSYQGTSTTSAQQSKSQESIETKNYEISQVMTVTKHALGAVKRLSVSVMLNAESLDATEQSKIENLVKNAVIFDNTRGDTITVAAQVFDTTFQEEVEAARAKTIAAESKKVYITYGLVVLTLVLFVLAFRRLTKPLGIPSTVMAAGAAGPSVSIADEMAEIDLMSLGGPDPAAQKLKQEAIKITRENPENAAKVIKTWLKE